MTLKPGTAAYEAMSPTLLAAQPPSLDDPQNQGKDWGVIFSYLESRLQGLKMWRYSWWGYWAVIAEFILPRRYHWLIVANRMTRGNAINNAIIDSTATLAVNICASGLWTGLTSPSRPWFKLGIGLPWIELDKDGKAWLEDTEQKIYTVFAQSNFYNTMAQAFQDVCVFGTAPVIIYEDVEDIIRCYLPCAGEFYLSVGARLSVDTFYREFTLTVGQIVDMFTLEKCPADIRELWATGGGSLEMERVVAHAIEPNFALSGRGGKKKVTVVPGMFPYREMYWMRGDQTNAELSRKGFHERPFMTARWSTVSNDAYGRSPGMDALGDVKQIQVETRRKAEYIEKGVRPPMGADPELKNEPSSIQPANITYTSTAGGKKGFWPLFEIAPAWLSGLIADIKEVQERINRCFFVDIFMAISRMEGVQPRNELELTKRDLERLQVLGPFINQFETEFAGPAIERVIAILDRKRLLKPMPASLRGIPLKINYVSIMKLAQRGAETVALKDILQTGGELSEAAKAAGLPDPLRTINLDKAMRLYVDLANGPSEIVYTEDEVKQADAQRAKMTQQQQAMNQTMAGVQAAQALGNAKTGGGTALGAILGNGAQGSA